MSGTYKSSYRRGRQRRAAARADRRDAEATEGLRRVTLSDGSSVLIDADDENTDQQIRDAVEGERQ
jgi:hypothetical protein